MRLQSVACFVAPFPPLALRTRAPQLADMWRPAFGLEERREGEELARGTWAIKEAIRLPFVSFFLAFFFLFLLSSVCVIIVLIISNILLTSHQYHIYIYITSTSTSNPSRLRVGHIQQPSTFSTYGHTTPVRPLPLFLPSLLSPRLSTTTDISPILPPLLPPQLHLLFLSPLSPRPSSSLILTFIGLISSQFASSSLLIS